MAEKIKVALLGAGNVGSQAARILVEDNAVLEKRIGAPVELIGIAVRDTNASRHWNADPSLYTTDAESLIDAADVVIELTGGIEPARTRILRALKAGKSVVSGNKALLAKHGVELQAAADESGAQLSYEAAVAGAIPILRPLRDSLAGDRVTRVLGIMNGTTNYILDQMDTTGASFADALAEAQKLGYAEADPTADVEGHDAASKAAIVASLAFHSDFTIDDVHTEGITSITADDVAAADADGYVIKLLAICEREGADGANIRVNPTLIPRQHPLAGVHGAFNAVFVEAENAGELMFYGPGAGGAPTASAVLGDFVSLARRLVLGGPGVPETSHAQLHATSLDNVISRYSVGVLVEDRLGVLANITRILAEHGISVDSLRQSTPKEGAAQIRMVTHSAKDSDLRRAIAVIDALDTVREVNSVIRVESEKH
ncbi:MULTISPECIES: homoserine dehydrogenase [Rothia]|uniref:Homoserine dehydrogenase n=1 Tax=Rothia mucilaginosa TaxID=43675 RepID=A0A943ZFC5_9MICC|nr:MULTISPECIES: homoserine dehydrogenase [Rothia]MBF1662985.1 homoserine dehydrogenase [Rothia mucilaginosa]MBS6979895.1 homoserine dehydrogenase [Rothia mucilaginosa]MDU2571410.1 homoserine dehydrogenase [Rothia mucilaginosa]OFJ99758.1 homoserine dehydrogenase [Rothia sp. HMSC065C12]OFO20376.1 homoserine dehydrogenase [Rothia sp. HMSC061C12]